MNNILTGMDYYWLIFPHFYIFTQPIQFIRLKKDRIVIITETEILQLFFEAIS